MGHHRFKIMPKGEKHFFWAIVFDTKKEMFEFKARYDKQNGIEDGYGGFGAIVMPYEILNTETGKRRLEIGTCLFYKGNIGAGLISHEMLHCAMWYERLLNGNPNACFGDDSEERLCYILTYLVRSFVSKLYKLGIYGQP